MALIDKASLLMVPSTYEAGTLYNILPSGNRAPDSTDQNSGYDQTRADFTFDRGSNAAATRVNADGLIEKYRENLLTESNNFSDSDWIKSNTGVTSGQSGYDGSNDAWLLSISGGSSTQRVEQTVNQSGVQTFSAYVKKGTLNWVRIRVNATTIAQSYFDLENGVVGNVQSGLISRSIEDIGSGWYRCSIVFNSTSSTARIYPATGDGNTTQTSGNILIQNAQLETGLVATDYLDSGATTAKAGVLIDLPRINYDANGENGALLLEPSRQQLLRYSEYAKGLTQYNSPTIVQNHSISPDGGKNAFEFTTDAATFRGVRPNISITANGTYTASWFVKKRTSAVTAYCGFGFDFFGGTSRKINYIIFDEYNGTATILQDQTNNTTTDVIDYGDYYRFIATATDTGSNTNLQHTFYPSLSPDGIVINTAANTIVAYGLQVEAGSYPTSYIPNHGESGGVTRAADSITSGTITAPLSGGYTAFIELETLSTSVYNQIQFRETSANYVLRIGNQINVGAGSTIQTNTTGMNKFALQVSSGGAYELFKNGSSVATGTGITHDIELIKTDLAGQGVKQIAVFNEALTDAECITLTTL